MRSALNKLFRSRRGRVGYLAALLAFFSAGMIWVPRAVHAGAGEGGFEFFALFSDPKYTSLERGALAAVLVLVFLRRLTRRDP